MWSNITSWPIGYESFSDKQRILFKKDFKNFLKKFGLSPNIPQHALLDLCSLKLKLPHSTVLPINLLKT